MLLIYRGPNSIEAEIWFLGYSKNFEKNIYGKGLKKLIIIQNFNNCQGYKFQKGIFFAYPRIQSLYVAHSLKKFLFFTVENTEANRQWGIEQDWRKTASWLKFRGPIQCSKVSDTAAVNIKCPEIPVLKCFDKDPGEGFWSKFPSKELPKGPVTPICIE